LNICFYINYTEIGDIGINDQGTPSPLDDTINNITMSFDVSNQGIYAIYNVYIDVAFFTVSSDNTSALPENIIIGQSLNNYYSTFHSFTLTPDNNVTVIIDPPYDVGLITTNATLAIQISFSTLYAGILVDLNISIQFPWTALI